MSDETPMAICIGGPEAGHEYPAKISGTVMSVDVYDDDVGDHIIGSWTYNAQLYMTEHGGIAVWVSHELSIHDLMAALLDAYKLVHKGIR